MKKRVVATPQGGTESGKASPARGGDASGLQAGAPWPMLGRCPAHTGRSPYVGAQTAEVKWVYRVEGGGATSVSSPVIGADGTIYAGWEDGGLHAITPDGQKLWEFATEGPVHQSPAIGADGTIYVGTGDDGHLLAMGPDGREKWRFCADECVSSSPAIGADGTIYFGPAGDKLFAVSARGDEVWVVDIGSNWYASPAIGPDGTIYAGGGSEGGRYRRFYAITPDGETKWKFVTRAGRNFVLSCAIGDDGTIYLAADDGKLYAISPDGQKKWEIATKLKVFASSPAIGPDGTIYAACFGSWLHAISPDGQKKWQLDLGESTSECSPVVGADGTIYVGCGSKFYAIGPDGQRKWELELDDRVNSSPAMGSDGTIYVGCMDGGLWAIGPESGLRRHGTTAGGRGAEVRSTEAPRASMEREDPGVQAGAGTADDRGATGPGACGPQAGASWPMFGGDPAHTGRSPHVGPQKVGAYRYYPIAEWYHGLNPPAIAADGTIYAGCSDKKMYAISPDGQKLWEFRTRNEVEACPAIGADGTIYVGSKDKYFYAVAPDGREKWRFNTNEEIISSAVIGADGTIYLGPVGGKLYAIGPDGEERWSLVLGRKYRFNPKAFTRYAHNFFNTAIGPDGTIYAGCLATRGRYDVFYAISPDGKVRWKFKTQAVRWGGQSCAIGDDGTIYLVADDGRLHALLPDGQKKWEFVISNDGVFDEYKTPSIALDGTVYVACYKNLDTESYLYAISPDGEKKWQFPIKGAWWSSPIIGADGVVYIDSDGMLFAITPDGETKLRFAEDGYLAIGAGGRLYCLSGANIYIIEP